MYATIRRYTPRTSVDRQAIEDLRRRIEENFLPTVQDIRGFHSYSVMNVGDEEILSISVFEDRSGASESTRKAAEFVQRDPLRDLLTSPEVIEGELLVLKEAGVGVR